MSDYTDAQRSADLSFSVYIRTRDCIRTTETREYGRCFTCMKAYPFRDLEPGHFVKRSCKVLRYDEHNVHAQCVGCNQFKSGNDKVYRAQLVKLYGEKTVQNMRSKRFKSPKMYSASDLKDVAREFNLLTGKLSIYTVLKPFPQL